MHNKKEGSNLSVSDLYEFRPIQIDAFIGLEDIDTCKSHKWYTSVYEAVSQFTIEMKKNLETNQIDEVKFVQPHSFHLLKTLMKSCLSNKCSVVNKPTNQNQTKYNTTLINSQQRIVEVIGETYSSSVLYKDICVMTWEDKNLSENCNGVRCLGQQYVEVKGNVEIFQSSTNRQPPFFYGILTSGKEWIFLKRVFSEGGIFWVRDDSVFTLKE
jgi:hypothetical protein